MGSADWVLMVLGLLALAGYGALVATGRVALRDEQGRIRLMVVVGGAGAALVLVGLLMNLSD